MATEYTPKNWECGDSISFNQLNRMESGIQEALANASGFLKVGLMDTAMNETINTPWQTMADAADDGKTVILEYTKYDATTQITTVAKIYMEKVYSEMQGYGTMTYYVVFDGKSYQTSAEDGYPALLP